MRPARPSPRSAKRKSLEISRLGTQTVEQLAAPADHRQQQPSSDQELPEEYTLDGTQQVLTQHIVITSGSWPVGGLLADEERLGGKMINIGSLASLFGLPYAPPPRPQGRRVSSSVLALAPAWAEVISMPLNPAGLDRNQPDRMYPSRFNP